MKHLIVFSRFGYNAEPYLGLDIPTTHIQLSIRPSFVDVTVETVGGGDKIRDFKMQVRRFDLPIVQSSIIACLRGLGEDLLIVYSHHELIFGGVADLLLELGIPYVFGFDATCVLPWTQHHVIGSARDRLCFSQGDKDVFKRRYLFDCVVMDPANGPALLERLRLSATRLRLRPLSRSANDDRNMNVLLVSYYHRPSLSVAVHRIRYWEQRLGKVAKERYGDAAPDIRTQVMTASQSHLNDRETLVVPDLGEVGVEDVDIRVLKTRLAAARVNWIGVHWMAHVKRWFDAHPDAHFDAVIMSGNPFMYFGLADDFKARFGAQVILDFRDPFSDNPRFSYTPAHKAIVEELEDRYLDSADASLTVNSMCRRSLRLRPHHVSEIVSNGFDEGVVDRIEPLRIPGGSGKAKFVYTGKFYADRDAGIFVSGLDPKRHRFLHIGWQSEADAHLDSYPVTERLGVMDYERVIGHCKDADAGVVFASGDAFEQTTKIFDYLAADLDIIIVTDGVVKFGDLHSMTKDLDGVYWVRNTKRAVAEFVRSYTPQPRKRSQRNRFSRGASTETLVELLIEGPNARPPHHTVEMLAPVSGNARVSSSDAVNSETIGTEPVKPSCAKPRHAKAR